MYRLNATSDPDINKMELSVRGHGLTGGIKQAGRYEDLVQEGSPIRAWEIRFMLELRISGGCFLWIMSRTEDVSAFQYPILIYLLGGGVGWLRTVKCVDRASGR